MVILKHLVYQKSPKGSEAIATRQHGLTPRLRSLLILVDGKRGFEELEKLSPGDTGQLLGQLHDDGFIEPTAVADTAAAVITAPAPLAPTSAAITLADAKRFAVRRLTDVLGPNAEELCLRIEAARTVHDFTAAIARAEGIVRQYKGADATAQLVAEFQAHLPTA